MVGGSFFSMSRSMVSLESSIPHSIHSSIHDAAAGRRASNLGDGVTEESCLLRAASARFCCLDRPRRRRLAAATDVEEGVGGFVHACVYKGE
jgi:hypothetical protein